MATPHRSASSNALRDAGMSTFPGITIYWIGDSAHTQTVTGHNPDDTPGVKAELQDSDNDPETRALDWMTAPDVFTMVDAHDVVQAILTHPDRDRLYYMILGSTIWSRTAGWEPRVYSGQYHGHLHTSGWAGDDENAAPWNSVLALGDNVSTADLTTPIPWQSSGAQNHAEDHGEGGPHSLAKKVDWLTDAIRYGFFMAGVKVPATVDGLDTRLTAIEDQLSTILAVLAAGGGVGAHTHVINGPTSGPVVDIPPPTG